MSEFTVQRFRGSWAAVWRDETGQRHRKRLYATDRAGAEAEARQRWAKGNDDDWTVGAVVAAYIDAREADGIASTGRQRDAWKAMKGFWDRVDPALVDKEMARKYATQRDRSESTVRYELSMLAVALRWAVNKGHIVKAPEIWRPAAPEGKVKRLTRPQFRKWFNEVKAPHARLYVRLGIATMARPTAILDLTWPQVDWEHETIDLNPPGRKQTKKRRPVVPLNREAMEALREAYEARQSGHIIERGAKRVGSIKKAFQAASARAGVKVTPYTLRHTGAVWAAEGGTSMAELAQYMGHDDDRTTQKHYARFSPDHLRGVAANLLLEQIDA
jgi:integrase